MKQTYETQFLCLNGYGSNEHESKSMKSKLYTGGLDAQCVDFCSSYGDPEQIAGLIDQRPVVTHSAGYFSAARAIVDSEWNNLPEELLGVNPPLRRNPFKLVVDSHKIVKNSAIEAAKTEGARREIALQTASLAAHVLQHLPHHTTVIKSIARFNSLDFAAQLAERDVPVSLVFMKDDEFFNLSKMGQLGNQALVRALESGVAIHELAGHHVDFTHRPMEVLDAVRHNIGRVSLAQVLDRKPSESRPQLLQPVPA